MTTDVQDVDDIWAEMQQESRAKRSTQKVSSKAFDLSSLQREKTKPKETKKLDASLHWMKQWAGPVKLQTVAGVPHSSKDGHVLDDLAAVRMTEPPSTLLDALDEIPTSTPEVFLAYLQRDINCLGEDNLGVRLQSMQKLHGMLVGRIDTLSTDVVDKVADALLKPLLKRMKDKSEKIRELSVRVLRSLFENASDLGSMLAYAFPTLVARLGAEDIDGIAHLPEVMRPDAEQKPVEFSRPVEESEEVRLELARFVASLLARCNQTQIFSYIDEATGLLRAGAMDPFHEVKALSCETMIAFCHNHTEMLLHFSEPLGRSLMSSLTHNHAKIRIAALRALTAVFWCGVWKHNHEIVQQLMAWQDPNKASIKAFYETVTSVNYMSMLSFDRHPAVRRFWFETLSYWLLRVPDKVDHEPYIFPYLLAGLCDENEDIALECFWLIEKCGELYETEKEEELRKTRQYGFDYGWTYQGRAFVPFPLQGVWGGGKSVDHVRRSTASGPDMMGERDLSQHQVRDKFDGRDPDSDLGPEVPLPERDYCWPELRDLAVYRKLPRPRLGSRCWVRTHTRRYIKATFNDVVDFRDCTALNAGRLLCMSLAYSEEGVTEWLQPMVAALCKFYSGRAWAAGDQKVVQVYDCVCKQVGVFLEPISYWHQCRDAFSADSILDLDLRVASVRVLALAIEGSVAALQSVQPPDPKLGMGRLEEVIPELISCLHSSDLLLSPTTESRAVLWSLLFSFLEALREHLTQLQISQLLFIALALAAKAPSDAVVELASSSLSRTPGFDEEELVDVDNLERALDVLGRDLVPKAPAPECSLDSLDDDLEPAPAGGAASATADPRARHLALFERAFGEVLACTEDSFQVFRSVVYLTPLSILTSAAHRDGVLRKLGSFCGSTAMASMRASGHALAVHLALRCAKVARAAGTAGGDDARAVIFRLFSMMASAQLEAGAVTQQFSYMVLVSGLASWRQFFLHPDVDPRDALFGAGSETAPAGSSKPLEWMTTIFADQELYKKFHRALEHAETSTTGRDKEGFVLKKVKMIREEADHRAAVARSLAVSTVLLILRRMLAEGGKIPWCQRGPGSAAGVFSKAASLLRTAEHTMDPPFVKPTPAYMVMYASELLHTLLHLPSGGASLRPFRLLDDAQRAIHGLESPGSVPALPEDAGAGFREGLTADFVGALVDLNLTLPPDPNAKHAPATLDEAESGDILLGWDASLTTGTQDDFAEGHGSSSKSTSSNSVVPREILRVLAQSPECLGWNAALSMYVLGIDLSVVCKDGFQQNVAKWQRRKEQARVLIAADLLHRAGKVLQAEAKTPKAIAPK